jgi:hypothetical protein
MEQFLGRKLLFFEEEREIMELLFVLCGRFLRHSSRIQEEALVLGAVILFVLVCFV